MREQEQIISNRLKRNDKMLHLLTTRFFELKNLNTSELSSKQTEEKIKEIEDLLNIYEFDILKNKFSLNNLKKDSEFYLNLINENENKKKSLEKKSEEFEKNLEIEKEKLKLVDYYFSLSKSIKKFENIEDSKILIEEKKRVLKEFEEEFEKNERKFEDQKKAFKMFYKCVSNFEDDYN